MRFSVLVETRPRAGVADPEGATIERSLPALGFHGVSGVRVGKAFRFTVEAESADAARAEVDDMCRRFLTNPVIEDADVTVAAVDEQAQQAAV
jgi:phosphoribosylformylglycinamidine synthase subunit PurS